MPHAVAAAGEGLARAEFVRMTASVKARDVQFLSHTGACVRNDSGGTLWIAEKRLCKVPASTRSPSTSLRAGFRLRVIFRSERSRFAQDDRGIEAGAIDAALKACPERSRRGPLFHGGTIDLYATVEERRFSAALASATMRALAPVSLAVVMRNRAGVVSVKNGEKWGTLKSSDGRGRPSLHTLP